MVRVLFICTALCLFSYPAAEAQTPKDRREELKREEEARTAQLQAERSAWIANRMSEGMSKREAADAWRKHQEEVVQQKERTYASQQTSFGFPAAESDQAWARAQEWIAFNATQTPRVLPIGTVTEYLIQTEQPDRWRLQPLGGALFNRAVGVTVTRASQGQDSVRFSIEARSMQNEPSLEEKIEKFLARYILTGKQGCRERDYDACFGPET